MKKSFIILVFFSLVLQLKSQEIVDKKNTLRFGINRTLYASGDIFGTSIYSEYSYKINKRITASPRISYGFAYVIKDGTSDHLSSFGINLNADITPFPSKLKKFKFCIGPLYLYQAQTYGEAVENLNGNDYRLINTITIEEKKIGALIGLKCDIFETEKIELGARFDMLTNFGGFLWTDSWQFGVYFGTRF